MQEVQEWWKERDNGKRQAVNPHAPTRQPFLEI